MATIKSSEEATKAEALSEMTDKKVRGEKLLEKWAGNSIGKELGDIYASNPAKARYGAWMLESQERYMKQCVRLQESAISANFQTTPENVLKIIKIGVANSIRGDLFHEIPLVTPDDALYYLERKIDTTFVNRGTAAQIINENINPYYPSEQAVTTSVGTTATQYSITAGTGLTGTNIPIRPSKVLVLLDQRLVGMDDGNGTIVPVTQAQTTPLTGLTASPTATYQTVVYATGVVKLEFDAAVPATSTIAIITSWDSENSALYGQYGKVTLSTRKVRFAARPEPLGYEYTQMAELLLSSTMGVNTDSEMIEAVGLEHALAKDYRAIARAINIANKNQSYTYSADFAAAGEVSENAHAQNLLSEIDLIGGELYNTKKRGMINKALVGTNMLTYMRKHKLWEENRSAVKEGPYKAGNLAGIDVFACPVDATASNVNTGLTKNDAILFYKNPREGLDIPMAIGVLTELSARLTYPTMNVVGNIASVESILVLESAFAKKLTLTGYGA